jgi:hypothetical protein
VILPGESNENSGFRTRRGHCRIDISRGVSITNRVLRSGANSLTVTRRLGGSHRSDPADTQTNAKQDPDHHSRDNGA